MSIHSLPSLPGFSRRSVPHLICLLSRQFEKGKHWVCSSFVKKKKNTFLRKESVLLLQRTLCWAVGSDSSGGHVNGLGGREPEDFVLGGTGDQASAWKVALTFSIFIIERRNNVTCNIREM